MFNIRMDDLSGESTQTLLARHVRRMQETSPTGHVFALDLSGLKASNVTVWTVWDASSLAGIGAKKDLGDGTGELKSMRTDSQHLRKGVAAALLEHIIGEARKRDFNSSVWRQVAGWPSSRRSRFIANADLSTALPSQIICAAIPINSCIWLSANNSFGNAATQ